MKCQFQLACLLIGLAVARVHAAADFYVNDGIVVCPPEIPPQVDATNFVNRNYFSINFTNFLLPQLYATDNTLNFTNLGTMLGNTGFRFDWFVKTNVAGVKGHKMAANFVNEGTISSGAAANNTNLLFGLFLLSPGLPKTQISATNVLLRSSTNIVGVDGIFSLTGKNVDLGLAHIAMEGFEDTPTNVFAILTLNSIGIPGLSATYWGIGTNQNLLFPAADLGTSPAVSPQEFVVTPNGGFGVQQLVLSNATFHVRESINGTNRFVEAVFVNNTNTDVLNNVYFPSFFRGSAVVEWLGVNTNQLTGIVTTNLLYLTDSFSSFFSNYVATNFTYYSAAGTGIPANYTFTPYPPFFSIFFGGLGNPVPPTSPSGVFDPVSVTNEYSAFGASFAPSSVSLNELPPLARDLTNLPGRIEITADSILDLEGARIAGLNYMRLRATNHVTSVDGAKISVPYSDISLGTTNGKLTITNLLFPVVQRFTGQVDLWSGRWTNNFGGLQSVYSVLMVDSHLSATAPSRVQDLSLRSTNLIISDVLNVTRKLLLDSERVTITTNQLPAATPRGELNMQSSAITWSTATPRLQYLTNDGGISALNAMFLGGSRSSPFYSSNFNERYVAFVNRGTVTTEGSLIWADYFENSGQFEVRSSFGSIDLDSLMARLTNGSFRAPRGSLSIAANSLTVSNHLLLAGRELTLRVTNLITDGYPLTNQFGVIVTTNNPVNSGITNGNFWFSRGLNLSVHPTMGDLLATTVSNIAPAATETVNHWAGEDRGCSPSGYLNNAAIGRLILDGGAGARFAFRATGESNALYVDNLELKNSAALRDANGNFLNLRIDPNMRIYYAQAIANGASIAEKLNGANTNRFCWVSNYAGAYSSTDVVYPDGNIYRFNAALIESCTINSDPDLDDVVNCADLTPVFVGSSLELSVALTPAPASKASISWNTVAHSKNYVYYKNSSAATNWQVLTNFALGPIGGRVTVLDPTPTGDGRYYRVRVDR